MTHAHGNTPKHPRPNARLDPTERDRLINALLDGELAGDERRNVQRLLAVDPGLNHELRATSSILARLKSPGAAAPDFTDTILTRVHRRRRFLPPSVRRMVTVGRVCVAASLLAGVGVIALIDRYAPGVMNLRSEPALVSAVVQSSASDAAGGVQTVSRAVNSLSSALVSPTKPAPLGGPGPASAVRVNTDVNVPAALALGAADLASPEGMAVPAARAADRVAIAAGPVAPAAPSMSMGAAAKPVGAPPDHAADALERWLQALIRATQEASKGSKGHGE